MQRSLWILALIALCSSGLSGQDDDFGKWTVLFDGKDASGWVGAKGEHKGKPAGELGWHVEDGGLTNGKGGGIDVHTAREFDNYELELDYKVPAGGNSGVYLRGQIEVQVFDNKGVSDDQLKPHHAGSIYGGFVALKNPQKPAGEWNQFRIRHVGHRITVWHNGVLVQDNVYRDHPTPGHMSGKLDPTRGPIMFQGDHSKVWYRNIRIRPLASGEGWRPLWNGEDLSQFSESPDGKREVKNWTIEDHAFTNIAIGGGGRDLWTKEPFGNFLLHYEYRSKPDDGQGGNSGLYLRNQWEIQIFREASLTSKGQDGSLYSLRAPAVLARHGPRQWNHMDVKVEGQKIWIWQNGKLIHDGVVLETRTDNHRVPTRDFSKAPFKFQGDHGKVWFTNLFIRELPDST